GRPAAGRAAGRADGGGPVAGRPPGRAAGPPPAPAAQHARRGVPGGRGGEVKHSSPLPRGEGWGSRGLRFAKRKHPLLVPSPRRGEGGKISGGPLMPIFDQGYQHWKGTLSGHATRWLTITRHGVRAQMKNRWTRLVLLFAWFPAILLVVALVVWGLVEQQSPLITPVLRA